MIFLPVNTFVHFIHSFIHLTDVLDPYHLKLITYNPGRDVLLLLLYSGNTTDISSVWSERPTKFKASEQQKALSSPCTR